MLHKSSLLLSPQTQFRFLSLVFPFASNTVCEGAQASLFSGIFDSVFLLLILRRSVAVCS